MKQHEINNYLSFKKQYKNKNEDACPLFYGDFAVADSDLHILASRGVSLCEGTPLALTDANRRFLMKTLTENRWVALRQRSGILLVVGDLLSAGLYAILKPHGDKSEVAGAMTYLAQTRNLIPAPAVRKLVQEESTDAENCMAAEDEMALLDGFLRPEPEIAMSELCERIASYAGCRIRFAGTKVAEEKRPAGREVIRLTGFLLCAFLILRKQEPDGLTVSIRKDDGGYCLAIESAFPLSAETQAAVCNSLRQPAFDGFALEWV